MAKSGLGMYMLITVALFIILAVPLSAMMGITIPPALNPKCWLPEAEGLNVPVAMNMVWIDECGRERFTGGQRNQWDSVSQMCLRIQEQGFNTMNFESKQEAIDYSHDLGLGGKVHEHENTTIFLGMRTTTVK